MKHTDCSKHNNFIQKNGNTTHLDPVDQLFKDKLADHELEPNPELWQKIKADIPINLLLKIYLSYISKVAAVLIFGMVSIALFNQYPSAAYFSNGIHPAQGKSQKEEQVIVNQVNVQPHQAGPENNDQKNQITKRGKKVQVATETKALLNAILADDEFAAKIDLEKINRALQPIQPLPVSSAQANTNNNFLSKEVKEPELIISVPLKVVEEHEIDYLLKNFNEKKQ